MSMYKLWKQYPLCNLVLTTVEIHNVLSFIKNQKRCKMFWNNFRGTICLRMLSFYLWLSNMAQKNISTKKKFQTTCFSAIADFILCFGFCTSFELISQLLIIRSKRRFSNPALQNWHWKSKKIRKRTFSGLSNMAKLFGSQQIKCQALFSTTSYSCASC